MELGLISSTTVGPAPSQALQDAPSQAPIAAPSQAPQDAPSQAPLAAPIVFGGTAVQRAERQGLAYAILVAAFLGFGLNIFAAVCQLRGRQQRGLPLLDSVVIRWWEETGEISLLVSGFWVAIVAVLELALRRA